MSHYLNIGHTQVECAAVGIMAQDKLLSYFRNKFFLICAQTYNCYLFLLITWIN